MKIKKTVIAFLLIITMTTPVLAVAQSKTLNDVQSTDWYYNAVTYVVNAGGINGYADGSFKPDSTMTYAEFIKTCVYATTGKTYPVNDNSKAWYSGVCDAAVSLGIYTTDEITAAMLDQNITRADMALIAVRINENVQMEASVDTTGVQKKIADYSSIPASRQSFVMQAYKKGLLSGKGNGFDAFGYMTRAEAATVVYRLLLSSVRLDISALPDINNAKAVFDQIPTYTTDLGKGLSFAGVGYTVEDASLLAYNFTSAYCNYDGTNLAAMDARYNTLVGYMTDGNSQNMLKEKQGIIDKAKKAQSDVYMTASKVEIKDGRFYAHGTIYDHVSGRTLNVVIRMGSDTATPTKMAVDSISLTEVK